MSTAPIAASSGQSNGMDFRFMYRRCRWPGVQGTQEAGTNSLRELCHALQDMLSMWSLQRPVTCTAAQRCRQTQDSPLTSLLQRPHHTLHHVPLPCHNERGQGEGAHPCIPERVQQRPSQLGLPLLPTAADQKSAGRLTAMPAVVSARGLLVLLVLLSRRAMRQGGSACTAPRRVLTGMWLCNLRTHADWCCRRFGPRAAVKLAGSAPAGLHRL